MNSQQAQDVLAFYRPEIGEPADRETLNALELSRRDPRLARWLEQRNALYQAIRGGLKQIESPAGLKERIVAERPAKIIWWQRPIVLAQRPPCLAKPHTHPVVCITYGHGDAAKHEVRQTPQGALWGRSTRRRDSDDLSVLP